MCVGFVNILLVALKILFLPQESLGSTVLVESYTLTCPQYFKPPNKSKNKKINKLFLSLIGIHTYCIYFIVCMQIEVYTDLTGQNSSQGQLY